ncbi:hypothetical protein [Hymenobacter siberiensis]|uniref:hypothetical protein n=1 Tax=Hymenobacter siberiensis TaxID=2848396 RepID=UPI001C1E264E|nr:hypothetical protein [Hymenobacter siberiensis]MBU6119486.1 hypothetical protein [Hymenobacter siberiensis]
MRGVGAHASAYGYETTGRHAGHLAQLLSQCLGQTTDAEWATVARQPARTMAQLPADAPAALGTAGRGAAILREAPRRGLYYRFEHFLANRPDTVSPFLSIPSGGATRARWPRPSGCAWRGCGRWRARPRTTAVCRPTCGASRMAGRYSCSTTSSFSR